MYSYKVILVQECIPFGLCRRNSLRVYLMYMLLSFSCCGKKKKSLRKSLRYHSTNLNLHSPYFLHCLRWSELRPWRIVGYPTSVVCHCARRLYVVGIIIQSPPLYYSVYTLSIILGTSWRGSRRPFVSTQNHLPLRFLNCFLSTLWSSYVTWLPRRVHRTWDSTPSFVYSSLSTEDTWKHLTETTETQWSCNGSDPLVLSVKSQE